MIATEKKFTLNIASDPINILKIEGVIDQLGVDLNIPEEAAANMYVAVIEAVKNAIIFGNNSDPNKMISISVDRMDKKIEFIIKDEGKGFDFNNVPDPTSIENIEKIAGRGIFLMKNLSDSLEFLENGSKVILTFNA